MRHSSRSNQVSIRDIITLMTAGALTFSLNRLARFDDLTILVWTFATICVTLCSITISLAALTLLDAIGKGEHVRGPGKFLLVGTASTFLLRMCCEWYFLCSPGMSPGDRLPNYIWAVAARPVLPAGAVVAVVTTLWLSGGLRGESDWRGSVGIALALFWPILALIEPVILHPQIFQELGWASS